MPARVVERVRGLGSARRVCRTACTMTAFGAVRRAVSCLKPVYMFHVLRVNRIHH